MADIGKNGYQWTGYTEPFITSVQVVSGTALDSVDYDGYGNGIVAIENTEWKNSGLYLISATGVTAGTTFTARFINFDYKMDDSFTGIGQFVITDGVDVAAITSIEYVNSTFGSSHLNSPGIYNITVDSALTIAENQQCRVIARKPDIGGAAAITASKTYQIGDRIQELYAAEA